MHAVRRTLLERQAEAVQLPLKCIYLPWPCSNADYEPIMSRFCAELVENGVGTVAFGDLFLEDVRNYRLSRLKDTGLKAIFPLWKLPTRSLAEEMITSGLQAKITCVNPKQLARIDHRFGNEGDFGRPERFSESFAIDPVQVE